MKKPYFKKLTYHDLSLEDIEEIKLKQLEEGFQLENIAFEHKEHLSIMILEFKYCSNPKNMSLKKAGGFTFSV